MKVLSVQQPWASLICTGIKDVENRTWKAAKVPGRILIHASSKKVTKYFHAGIPEALDAFIQNEISFGNIPELETLPTSAIVGYVTVTGFEEGDIDSVWADDGAIKWTLEDAWLFDEPILNVKGKLNLFDYDLDEDNLPPAHQVQLETVDVTDDETEVQIPCTKEALEKIKAGDFGGIELNLTPYLSHLLCVENAFKMKPFKTVTVFCGNNYIAFELGEDSGIFNLPDPQDETKPYMILDFEGNEIAWMVAEFMFGKKLEEGEFEMDDEDLEEEGPKVIDYSNDRNAILKVAVDKKDFNDIKSGIKEYALEIPHQELSKYCEMDEDGDVKEIDEELQPRKYKEIQFVYKKESYTCKLEYARIQPKQYVDAENYTYVHDGKVYDLLEIVFELGDEIKQED